MGGGRSVGCGVGRRGSVGVWGGGEGGRGAVCVGRGDVCGREGRKGRCGGLWRAPPSRGSLTGREGGGRGTPHRLGIAGEGRGEQLILVNPAPPKGGGDKAGRTKQHHPSEGENAAPPHEGEGSST